MTKDTEKALVILYCEYKRRRGFGTSKAEDVHFEEAKMRNIEAFSDWNYADISYAMQQLRAAGYVKLNILGDVTLTESAIEYIEAKPKEYFDTFLKIASLIPVLGSITGSK